MVSISRRTFLTVPVGAGLAAALPPRAARAVGAEHPHRSFRLGNGLRVHLVERDFGYTSLILTLRSEWITHEDGLGHIMEHTSFVGAAGSMSAAEVKEHWKDHVQLSNASTAPGEIAWQAMFLPDRLPRVLEILALTSLDQKFDVPTVEQERQVVLQELYADKYSTATQAMREFDQSLYGRKHPLVHDTVDAEIATARQPAERLAVQLRELAERLRLPNNMDLYILGTLPGYGEPIEDLVERHFGPYPAREGAMLNMPAVPRTAEHRRLTRKARDLRAPLSEIEIGWNTGVTLGHRDAPDLTVAAAYLNQVLFDSLREENGDSYAPEAKFEPTDYAGIFHIYLATTKNPYNVERNVFRVMHKIRDGIPDRELARFRERLELSRRREKRQDDMLMDNMIQRNVFGLSLSDLDVASVTADRVTAVAVAYLPEYRGAYVRLARLGRGS